MDSHLKERIVGAAVLVALGVWLIPWVLDGPESPAEPEEIPGLTLPGADDGAPIRTEIVELAPARAAPADVETSRRADAGGDSAESRGDHAAAAAASDAAPGASPSADDGGDAAASGAELAAGGTVAGGTNAAAAASEPTPGWMVQLGAFSDTAGAQQVARGVSDFGYTAHISEHVAGSRTLYRVRIGGFESRAEAEAVRSSLMAHGYQPQVVAPE